MCSHVSTGLSNCPLAIVPQPCCYIALSVKTLYAPTIGKSHDLAMLPLHVVCKRKGML